MPPFFRISDFNCDLFPKNPLSSSLPSMIAPSKGVSLFSNLPPKSDHHFALFSDGFSFPNKKYNLSLWIVTGNILPATIIYIFTY